LVLPIGRDGGVVVVVEGIDAKVGAWEGDDVVECGWE
jgi:hypothetical protein